LRCEIINDGSGAADSIEQICSTIISEGGSQELGVLRYASTEGTEVTCATEGTIYAILGIRLKSAYLGATISFLEATLQEQVGDKYFEWIMILNPTVADTFTYSDEIQSAVQIARGAAANTVTGGYKLAGGQTSSAQAKSGSGGPVLNLQNALRLGSLIDGTPDEVVLCIRPVGGSANLKVEGSLNWRELL
jgi:hypothetical protein